MRRTHIPSTDADASVGHAATRFDPIDPLADQIGKAVALEMRAFRLAAVAEGDVGATIELRRLEADIAVLVAKVLDRSLSSPTAEGRAIRMALIAKLAGAEMEGLSGRNVMRAAKPDALVTTAEAARKLEVSRPYVSMLCDQGKLGEVVLTEGGHRRIRSSAIDAYLAVRTRQHNGAPSPREAAARAGLYELAERRVDNVVRGTPASPTHARPARKSRA